MNSRYSRLPERIEIGNRNYFVRVAVGGKIREYITSIIECKCHRIREIMGRSSDADVQLQLSSFKKIFDLAGSRITMKSLTRALDVAFLTLTIFSSRPLDSAIKGLVGILVERGAQHIDEHFLDASVYGTPELVRIFLQMAPSNNLLLPANKVLLYASERSNLAIMDSLVDEGNAKEHWRCLYGAAMGGCLPVVNWLVERGCSHNDLILALRGALRYGRIEMAAFLLPHVPRSFLRADDIMDIFEGAALEAVNGSFPGLELLLHSNYLGDAAETYNVAMALARNNHLYVLGLHIYLRQNWTMGAFWAGMRQGRLHFWNIVRILKWGRSALRLMDLPSALRVAIAYLRLYRECTKPGMRLLSQRQRGQLIVAAGCLGGRWLYLPGQRTELLAVCNSTFPLFLIKSIPFSLTISLSIVSRRYVTPN